MEIGVSDVVTRASARPGDERPGSPTVSVIVCAYTEERWPQLEKAIGSLQSQTTPPLEIILCIDHNDELLRKCEEQFVTRRPAGPVPLIVLANKYDGRLGAARNTAVEFASGDVVAFMDDDAAAAAEWLERLAAVYDDERIAAVGGQPLPVFEVARPQWFPYEFDWVFGCAYRGLPSAQGPSIRLIGANMSARRAVLQEIGGFHTDHQDDLDMCHRVAHAGYRVIYEPRAIVYHFVPTNRTTWDYFRKKCYSANLGKAEVFANMAEAASLRAELAFVRRALTTGFKTEMGQLIRGDLYGLARFGAMLAGIGIAGVGHARGKLQLRRSRSLRRKTPITEKGQGECDSQGTRLNRLTIG